MILIQRALFIPNTYYVILTLKSMENAAEKFNICLFFVCFVPEMKYLWLDYERISHWIISN